jgi:hypothetical protein
MKSATATSANFGFLGQHDAQLVRLGALAERYFRDDPNTCLIKLRQFGEVLAQLVAAKAGLYRSPEEPQADLLRRLNLERITPREVGDLPPAPPQPPGTFSNPYGNSFNSPKLYDGQGQYRGNLNTNPYDPSSVANPYGRYGSPYSPDSINNPYGAGSRYRQDSPSNPYGTGMGVYR